MRILFVSNLFPDTTEVQRGQDNAVLLGRLADLGHEVRVLALRPVLRAPWSKGGPLSQVQATAATADFRPLFVGYPYWPKVMLPVHHFLVRRSLAGALATLVGEWRPHVVLGSWSYPDLCALAPLARQHRLPWVGIVQGSDAHLYLRWPIRRQLIVAGLRQAHSVVTRSQQLRRLVVEAGVPAERVHTIYNGVDQRLFVPALDRRAARRAVGFDGLGPVVLYVGNFYPVKNPLLAVRAVAQLEGVTLCMIGRGQLHAEADRLGKKLGLGDRLRLLGHRDPHEVASYMRAADVLCVPSHNEGLPNVLLEALSSGLPVVSTRVGGMAEILREPTCGRLVPPNDEAAMVAGLREVLARPAQTQAMAAEVAPYAWERATAAYLERLFAAVDNPVEQPSAATNATRHTGPA